MADGPQRKNGSATRTFLASVAAVSGAVIAVAAVASATGAASEYLRERQSETHAKISILEGNFRDLRSDIRDRTEKTQDEVRQLRTDFQRLIDALNANRSQGSPAFTDAEVKKLKELVK